MFPAMFLLLRSKCLYCHKFRMDAVKVRQYLVKLKLLELGNITEFTNFDDYLVPPQVMMSLTVWEATYLFICSSPSYPSPRASTTLAAWIFLLRFPPSLTFQHFLRVSFGSFVSSFVPPTGQGVMDVDESEWATDLETRLLGYERQYDALIAARQRQATAQGVALHRLSKGRGEGDSSNAKALRRGVVDAFHKAIVAVKKCENCGCISDAFRKDGFSKIFQKPLPKRLRAVMRGKKPKSALDLLNREKASVRDGEDDEGVEMDDDDDDSDAPEESESEEEDDDDTAAATALANRRISPAARMAAQAAVAKVTESDKYLVPWETEGQIHLLWRKEGSMLDMIWAPCSTLIGTPGDDGR